MERDFLKNLSLNSDQIDKIMAQYGKDIQEYKNDADKNKELQASVDDLKDQLSQRDDQLKELQKSAGDNEQLKQKIDDLKVQNKEQTKQSDAKLAGIKKDYAIQNALRASGAKDPADLQSHLKTDKVSLDDNGNLIGLDDQIKGLKKSHSYLFKDDEENAKPKPKVSFSGNSNDGGTKQKSIVDTIAARMAKK